MKKVTFSVLMILALNATAMAGDNKDLLVQAQKKVTAVQDAANQNQVKITGGEVLVAGGSNLLSKVAKNRREALHAPLNSLNKSILDAEKEIALLGNDRTAVTLMKEDLIPTKAKAYKLEKKLASQEGYITKLMKTEKNLKTLSAITGLDALIRIGYTLAGKDVGILAIDNAVKDGSSFVSDQVQLKFVSKSDATRSLAVEPSDDGSKADIDVRFTK